MAEEEEDHSVMSMAMAIPTINEPRPPTARKASRKLPGGFGVNDVDDLSPDKEKEEFELPQSENVNPFAQNQKSRTVSLDPTTLPSLPAPDSSCFFGSEYGEGEQHHDLENEMERHLNDVEPSFLPPEISTIGALEDKGLDDTGAFSFDGANDSKQVEEPEPVKLSLPRSNEPTLPKFYKSPAIRNGDSQDDSTMGLGNTTSSLETMSSSPTAAAAARTVSRAVSMAGSSGQDGDTNHTGISRADEDSDEEGTYNPTPRRPVNNSLLDTTDNSVSNRFNTDAGSTPGAALLGRKKSGKSPKFLRSRHSHTSSVSSFGTNAEEYDESDATLGMGADYALQSGGAVPAAGFSRNESDSTLGLARSISLGSIASGIHNLPSGSQSPVHGLDGNQAAMPEAKRNGEEKPAEHNSPPETPRASGRILAAPTDTIIARHVRNVLVPESMAREYRDRSDAGSPIKRPMLGGSALSRGKGMTLKEQSNTIGRLSKENFDLKLRIFFLSQKMDKLSEEGVKKVITENVELRTGLTITQKENKALKKKLRDLEKKLKDDEERPSTSHSENSDGPSPKWFDHEGAQEQEEELIYLRERVEEYVTEIDKLRNDCIARENEKRNLAEVVSNMASRGQSADAREEMEVWKDLLEQETAHREQADEENKKLRDEIFRLRSETSSGALGVPGLNHTTNIYNITKKRQVSPSRPRSGLSDRMEDRNGAFSAASTLVEDLRRDCEQLRHENAELRREVGAQTSMLTSRNREKERLHQEIEDLKLLRRGGGGSMAGDSILDRSASRAHGRSSSRTSAVTRDHSITDAEREDFDKKTGELRDVVNSLKIHNQDLQRELQSCMEDFDTAVEQKRQAEAERNEFQEALETAEADLLTMQSDRDEALHQLEESEQKFEALREEAQEELDGFAVEAEESAVNIERLQTELADITEDYQALQKEMRELSEGVVRLEDDHEQQTRRIQDLERDLEEANKEMENLEQNLVDANGKIDRLTVQQESSQGEIGFLREEQDADKIKISDLETVVRNTEQSLAEERDRTRELEERLAAERHQREVIAGKEKQEVQQYINELNRENSTAKDEARRLRKNLTSREVEAAEWKERLTELENNLREALGDLNGTRSSLLHSIAKLQRELENTMSELDAKKKTVAEQQRVIRQRDSLLESHALEARTLADALEKEKQTHRNTKHQFETFQKTSHHTTRTLSQHETRVLELETTRVQDKRKIAALETAIKDQMNERNTLLLTMWNRLSAICGSDWTHNNRLINGRAVPSLEVISTMLPGFAKNLLAAVRTIEALVTDFKSRVRGIEKDLWKEYRTLESHLETRTKRLDRLEAIARSAIPGPAGDGRAEITRLKDLNRVLKTEVASLRAANEVQASAFGTTSPAPSVPTGPRNKSTDTRRTSTMTRTTTSESFGNSRSASANAAPQTPTKNNAMSSADVEYTPDLRWQIRLQELEYKLKAEREARKTDRSSARQRLQEASRENAELMAEVERNKVRASMGQSQMGQSQNGR
ncbi:hypothetical protein HYFRA_00013786 [Hymenoscyphus fraxineus]|uniref:Anucleate primary sterigmata protein B n=1 Tax=Hymenoscyphus fraxineus TaxID=746836 RepID=A0A9N9PZD7_9HELO|nr:hypothetical protein HYFRA_00013786 [Hymenoscyphus fraxineus]